MTLQVSTERHKWSSQQVDDADMIHLLDNPHASMLIGGLRQNNKANLLHLSIYFVAP